MLRNATEYLLEWSRRESRKPLVIRGARQVGKSYLVRDFAEQNGLTLLELNFDEAPDNAKLFASNSPEEIVALLELEHGDDIDIETTLLFLDEIQSAPEVFASLRYFYEKMPKLKVVAAGSLLEFALEQHSFSMPVGRIEYLHLGPMLFDEFVRATGNSKLVEYIKSYQLTTTIPDPIHAKLMKLYTQFMIIGGMPEAVKTFIASGSYTECDRVKSSIIATYKDDFSKYKNRADIVRLQRIFSSLPRVVGEKITYSKLSRDDRAKDVEEGLHLFELAKVIFRASHSSANGIPLGAEENHKHQKLLYLDVGLLSSMLGLSVVDFLSDTDTIMINAGSVCEQYVGQHLLYKSEFYSEPTLNYWVREKKGTSAEIDFVVSHRSSVIPVEVKAGKTGRLRSLHQFIEEKKYPIAVRFNTDIATIVETETINGATPFTLLSLPFYLVTEFDRLVEKLI